MNRDEQSVIDDLFGKVRQAEQQTGPRDPQAEEYIQTHVASQPAAPYYMAQAIVVQEEALNAAQARIQQLEQELASRPAGGGGFLGSLFGGGGGAASVPPPAPRQGSRLAQAQADDPQQPGGHGRHGAHQQGGGFMGGALQTAMAVAGGVIVCNMIADMLMPADAMAEEPPPEDPGADDGMDFGDEEF
ncbi:MAG: DUF2076 family protein [Gammaproteobacteria bacterium]|nr:DUF2076 family protein [Gammaproteobacteria bacterium]